MKILIATHNNHKIVEIKKHITKDIEFVSLSQFGDKEEVVEDGKTFFENAHKKAMFFYTKYNLPTLADDSGIVVKALKGEPGIFSSRYGGIDGDDANNNKKLLRELKNKKNRRAYYYCAFCYIDFFGRAKYFHGKLKGTIADKESGENGFGYDSLFIPKGYNKTFGVLSAELKSKISHRTQAFNKLSTYVSKEKTNHKKIIKHNVKIIFQSSNVIVKKRLLGGLSNYNYLISIDGALYVYRIPGAFGDFFVDRKVEIDNIRLLSEMGVGKNPEYFNVYNGHKISKYIEGYDLSVLNEEDFDECAKVLQSLHSINALFNNDYSPFERLEKYEGYIKEFNYIPDNRYLDFKNYLLKNKDFLMSQKLRMCHGDSQVRNFVKGVKMNLLDYEFSGNNDPLYDIACYANRDLAEGYKLLEIYFGEGLDEDKKIRFYLWRFFQCLQWYNVAVFKGVKGLSKELKIDFFAVSKMYLDKAEDILKIIVDKSL